MEQYEVQVNDMSVAKLEVSVDKLQDNVCTADSISSQDMSVARLSVFVDLFSDDFVRTVGDMNRPDDICIWTDE